MFLSFLTFISFSFFLSTLALPAAPSGPTADGNGILLRPGAGNLSDPLTTSTLPTNVTDDGAHLYLGGNGRPHGSKLWPEETAGKYFLRFHDFGRDIQWNEGAALLHKATYEVDGWIEVAKKHSYTPVDQEHSWHEGPVLLTIKPNGHGYLLGDMKYYLALMSNFHARYSSFWEWEAQLLGKGNWGMISAKGTARMGFY